MLEVKGLFQKATYDIVNIFTAQGSCSRERQGRGWGKLSEKWGTGIRLEVDLTAEGTIIGKEYISLASNLGVLAKMGDKLPLTYTRWDSIPKELKDAMWEEIKVRKIWFFIGSPNKQILMWN